MTETMEHNQKSLKTSAFCVPKINKEITIQHFEENDVIHNFLSSLNDDELKTLYITYDHLGSSFDLERSILFKKWLSSQDK